MRTCAGLEAGLLCCATGGLRGALRGVTMVQLRKTLQDFWDKSPNQPQTRKPT